MFFIYADLHVLCCYLSCYILQYPDHVPPTAAVRLSLLLFLFVYLRLNGEECITNKTKNMN